MPSHSAGKERDAESGLDYFGAKYYGSSMGRFMSPDPGWFQQADPANPQTWNQYSYGLNNPLANVDPTGKTCQTNSSDGTVYDYKDGKGCDVVDQADNAMIADKNVNAVWADGSEHLDAEAESLSETDGITHWLQLQATRYPNLPQISLQSQQFIQQVAKNTAGFPTICSVGAFAQLGNAAGAVGGSYDSNSGFKEYGTMRPMPDGPASGIAPVTISVKGGTNGHYSGGVTVRDPETRLGGGISMNDQGTPTVSASWAPYVLTTGVTATLGTIGDPKCQPHP